MFNSMNYLCPKVIRVNHVLRKLSIPCSLNVPLEMNLIPKMSRIEIKHLHTNTILSKRRKDANERKSFRVIEYSPKSKTPVVQVWRYITPRELGKVLNKDMSYIHELFLNKVYDLNKPIEDMQLLKDVIVRSGHRMETIAKPTDKIKVLEDKDIYPSSSVNKANLKPRPPVVTIMGHVDHGKTTLLDALRHSNVAEKEFGGITQHIGAFSVLLNSGARITFLDTPGHAAFSAMRARGANITDIVVLVVAADDGVMEQTVESIKMAKNANVPIIVAINKIDSPRADIERTKDMLLHYGLQVEDKGGDIQTVPISALKRMNLDALMEALVLQAELLQIQADYTGPVEAVVVESKVEASRGKQCTIVVKKGTLKKGSIIVAGTSFGKVRVIRNADNEVLEKVTPGYPAVTEGWRELPFAGEIVLEVESEKRAREVIQVRTEKLMEKKAKEEKVIIMQKANDHRKQYEENLKMKRKLGRFRLKPEGPRKPQYEKDDKIMLNLVIKCDVNGSLEAVLDTLDTYDCNLCEMDLVHYGVGAVTESDVELAQAFDAIIYMFNVDCPSKIKTMSEDVGVQVKSFKVIYKLVDDIKEELNSRLPAIKVDEVCGEAVVLQQFEINEGRKKVPVAGCRCVKGVLKKSGMFKLIRNKEVIFQGALSSLRHKKNEVDSIKTNLECGLQLSDKSITFQSGDEIQCIEEVSKPQQIKWDPGF
ncbi:hypothetical protein WA026_011831 [Henosepilachna vigintioctopunctata]|uniref:Translation initiation factor IF-2, mitochondrial n=1 Tax=Henosepilachna vigintioctopunctata TaxID=420089 RepID=A0AAW1ULF1_9CUCU